MTTIIYIPLDERPVNRIFPQILAEATPGIVLRTPPAELLGTKKRPANLGALWEWLEKELPGADKLLCSLDMLFYGGIAPSRIHQLSREEAESQLERLEQLKVRSPNIEVFAFSLIMRVPANNSSDEEPDYYRHYGQLIFRWGWLRDQLSRGQGGSKEREELTEVMAAIPAEVQCDYLQRRELNHFVNSEAIKLVERDIIDFLVIPSMIAQNTVSPPQSKENSCDKWNKLGFNSASMFIPGRRGGLHPALPHLYPNQRHQTAHLCSLFLGHGVSHHPPLRGSPLG